MAARSGSLPRYLLVRVLLVIPNVLILLTLVFVLLRVAPGDPVSAAVGGHISQDELQERREAAGLAKPLFAQYLEYLANVVRLDFGTTLVTRQQVSDILLESGGSTLSLTVVAIVIALLVGVPLGLLAARFRDTWLDVVIRLFGVLTYAAPVFFVGIIGIIIFSDKLDLLPATGEASPLTQALPTPTNIMLVDTLLAGDTDAFLDVLEHLILPGLSLGLMIAGVFIRLVRVNTAQTLRDDYVEAARARGVAERRVVFHHAFRNAMVPFVTVLGLQIAVLLGGAVLTEKTFNWPGIGSELVTAIEARDYIAVQGILTCFALAVVLISLLIDVVTAFIDPRVRY